jgi:hypothetical protein
MSSKTIKKIFFSTCLFLGGFASGFIWNKPVPESEKVYATYFGIKLTGAEIIESEKVAWEQKKAEMIAFKKQITERVVIRKAFEEEARRKKMTVSDLNAEIEKHRRDPLSEEEYADYIKNNPNDETRMPKEQLIAFIQDQKTIQKNQELLTHIMSKADVKYSIPEN